MFRIILGPALLILLGLLIVAYIVLSIMENKEK
jgi:phage shock protein PspC (stress-responsive transcriptional regulator)